MNTRTDDRPTQPSDKDSAERSGREQPGAGKARTADSSPGDPPPERAGTTPPDGPTESTRATNVTADADAESAAAAEPGNGQVRGADPRVDIATADSRPVADDTTTGGDRDTLKPGV